MLGVSLLETILIILSLCVIKTIIIIYRKMLCYAMNYYILFNHNDDY